MIYKITPCPKPRMTQSDRWKKRKCVQKYWQFKDQVRAAGVTIPEGGARITFVVPMPKSWSKKKKAAMVCRAHQQTPDIDNYLKSLLDSVFDSDSHIYDVRVTKLWGVTGYIEIIEEAYP